jgi:L-arabinose isomerase
MRAIRRPRLGLLAVILELYDKSNPELKPVQQQFARRLAERLEDFADVTFPGAKNTRGGVAEAMAAFDTAGVDLIVTVHLAYAPSLILLPSLVKTRLPLVLWNTQKITGIGADFQPHHLTENHGMHGVQDLANALNRARRPFEVVTSHWEDEAGLEELRRWAVAARTARELREMRVGLIGHPFPGMGDFGVDETKFLAEIGPDVARVSLADLAAAVEAAPEDEVRAMMAADREAFEVDPELDESAHRASSQMEWALREVVGQMKLDAIAVHYPVLSDDPRFPAVPFLAMAKLIGEGLGFGGEGDVTSASCVALMRQLFGQATFTEMFVMDLDGNGVLMSHYAESNPNMASPDRPIRLVHRDGWVGSGGPSASLSFPLPPGEVTLLNLTMGADSRPVFIATEVEVVDFFSESLPTPHFKIRVERPLADFLNAYARLGGSHHLALARGPGTSQIDKLVRILDWNTAGAIGTLNVI